MKKVIVVLTGGYLSLLGSLGFLGSVILLIFLALGKSTHFSPQNPLVIPFIYLPVVAWLLATGIGLILFKNWARYSLFLMSGLAILIGVALSAIFQLMPFHHLTNQTVIATVRIIVTGISIVFLILLPVFYCIFFTRKTVVALFSNPAQSTPQFNRPDNNPVLPETSGPNQ